MTQVSERPVEDRGTLRVDRSVVRKIAERAADESPGTTAMARKLAGVEVGTQGARVDVTGDGAQVRLRVDVALHYPAPVRTVVEDVRERVITEVERLTGYHVRGVDVTVSALRPKIRPRVE
ncbi:Uncharacterized conserved protein YloU, alkaline shock protein (Asp23) family [Actinokineospora alba]|uniref:Uncharacterized conserved protein YloU, alkaline shock protein (Asp23) family n=1 Tax=Actinokineospora alba TaxID=504798 RepID=A0A1H0U1K6_9PSEU|nr:Asp23/Gls24 family envelope stress response protein [Actinokineospora alba]TDP70845.1 putative alkaline shock family protein YloU [Actinokineospora alba]SDJ17911.1 Uncharacterized conserved protein YloU, alkaline shock protein (Asp23) family [Actinokineospora alba]SDP59940.1 Uncharacterized conserved protein YloU, alkaline shock protein (Asp23) family [Actinokineospora alba]